jgi:uncharacterized protein
MSKLPWTPWHKVVKIRDDLKSGELSLAVFAADLYDVTMKRARPVYQDPREVSVHLYDQTMLRGIGTG